MCPRRQDRCPRRQDRCAQRQERWHSPSRLHGAVHIMGTGLWSCMTRRQHDGCELPAAGSRGATGVAVGKGPAEAGRHTLSADSSSGALHGAEPSAAAQGTAADQVCTL